jgi:hypothetical protein
LKGAGGPNALNWRQVILSTAIAVWAMRRTSLPMHHSQIPNPKSQIPNPKFCSAVLKSENSILILILMSNI